MEQDNTTRYTHSTYHAKTILQDEHSLTAYYCSPLGQPRSPRSVYGPDRHELLLDELLALLYQGCHVLSLGSEVVGADFDTAVTCCSRPRWYTRCARLYS